MGGLRLQTIDAHSWRLHFLRRHHLKAPVGISNFHRSFRSRLFLKRNPGFEARALTLTDDLKVVALSRSSLDNLVARPRWLDEEELVINGDPNEVVKTLDARRDLEVAYSSDSDTSVKDSPPPDPTCARRNMETAWASVSPVSTSSISSLDSPLVSTGRSRGREKRARGRNPVEKSADDIEELNRTDEKLLRTLEHECLEYQKKGAHAGSPSTVSFWYARLMNRLLTTKEEQCLGMMVLRGKEIKDTMSDFESAYGRSPNSQELADLLGISTKELARRLDQKTRAKAMLVEFNLCSVVPIAKSLALFSKCQGLDLSDLLVAGRDGLESAAERYDPRRAKFITHAYLWVKQSVQRCLQEQARVIKLPANVNDKLRKICSYMETQKVNGETQIKSHKQIAQALGLTVNTVRNYIRASRYPVSFDAPVFSQDAEGSALHEVVPDTRTSSAELSATVREQVNLALSTLPPRERNIIRMRYGLCGDYDDSMTLKNIGSTYGLSYEGVRKIETEGLKKLRQPWRMALLEQAEMVLDSKCI